MVARVRGHVRPGTLTLADLADYRPMKREPVCGPYRVWIVCGMPPPSSGGVAILQTLGCSSPSTSADAQRPARAASVRRSEPARLCRSRPLSRRSGLRAGAGSGLHRPGYIAERRKLISDDRSMAAAAAGGAGLFEHGTSHMTIVDRAGDVVTFTTTIETPFGAQMMVRGFILNNQLTDFSSCPTRRQAGRQPGPAGQAAALVDVADLRARPRPPAGRCRSARPAGSASSATRFRR